MDPTHFSNGASPGDGVTLPALSREPLATEGEATPGPDDYNPFDEIDDRRRMRAIHNSQRQKPEARGVSPETIEFDLSVPSLEFGPPF